MKKRKAPTALAMTASELVFEAARHRTHLASKDDLCPSKLIEPLRFILGELMGDIDYEARTQSGSAIAARGLATMISIAEELAAIERARRSQH